ncbi:hypothetical protein E2C01_048514 [Portunus trituberculatus]|uniref:Uncharacterized protein n=1 Tax=Portunus trituberculatus TaxID=210409 RepID=A0A5B7G414_PORTR|nr:hypothetical protein [Portunus trituberculatus]
MEESNPAAARDHAMERKSGHTVSQRILLPKRDEQRHQHVHCHAAHPVDAAAAETVVAFYTATSEGKEEAASCYIRQMISLHPRTLHSFQFFSSTPVLLEGPFSPPSTFRSPLSSAFLH